MARRLETGRSGLRAVSSAIGPVILQHLPVLIALGYALWLTWRVNRYFIYPEPALIHELDEGYLSAFARRLLEGHDLPYVDAVSHRGPLFYWSAALAVKVFGYGTWLPMRVLSLGCMLLTLVSGFLAAALARRSLSGAILALAYVAICSVSLQPSDGLAYGSEHLLNVFAMGGLLCASAGLRDGRPPLPGWVFAAGVCASLSGLSKQPGLVLAIPLSLWIFAAASGQSAAPRLRWSLPLAYVAGLLLPI